MAITAVSQKHRTRPNSSYGHHGRNSRESWKKLDENMSVANSKFSGMENKLSMELKVQAIDLQAKNQILDDDSRSGRFRNGYGSQISDCARTRFDKHNSGRSASDFGRSFGRSAGNFNGEGQGDWKKIGGLRSGLREQGESLCIVVYGDTISLCIVIEQAMKFSASRFILLH